jgi:hypothetical protein
MKSWVATAVVAVVSSANSVSNHSVAVRPFMLNPLRLLILRNPVSVNLSKQRCAVLRLM